MTKGNPVGELVKFFKELPGAPKHLKVMMVVAVIMQAGSGLGMLRGHPTMGTWPLPQVLLTAAIVAGVFWLAGFILGFVLRKEPLKPIFPPYEQLGKGALPSLIAGVGCGMTVGMLGLDLSPVKAAAYSFSGWLGVIVVTLVLFKLYTPVTEKAVQRTRQPSIIVADAYRGMWVFPALGTLALFLGSLAVGGAEIEALRPLVVLSGIATSVVLAGVASGFLP